MHYLLYFCMIIKQHTNQSYLQIQDNLIMSLFYAEIIVILNSFGLFTSMRINVSVFLILL